MDRAKKRSIIVKGVCLLLSFILWLYVSNVENPIRTSDLKGVSVELLNQEILNSSNWYLSKNQNFSVDLKLEGKAKDIYSLKKDDFVLKADLNNYALKVGENNIPVEIISAPQDVTIKNRSVLTVKVNLEEGSEKTVKVRSNVKTTFKEGISKKSIKVSPESVKISGPESLVKNVDSVVLKGELLDISKDTSRNFNLVAVDSDGNEISGVQISESIGKLTVSVGGSKQVKVNVVKQGMLPSNYTLKGINLSVESVNIIGDTDIIKSIHQVDTEPIDLSNITESQTVNVKLNLPEGIYLMDNVSSITANIEVVKKEEDTNKIVNKKIEGIKVELIDKVNTTLTYDVSNITVEVSGDSKEVSALTSENISATVSVAGIATAGEQEMPLNVSLKNAGPSVTIVSKPEKVKIIAK